MSLRLRFALAYVALFLVGAVTVQLVGGPSVEAPADFATAVATCTDKRMIVASEQAVANSVAVAASCTLEFQGAGSLAVANTKVVTINGQVLAAKRQIFSGAGTVTFPVGSKTPTLYPEWWGAVMDGTTDDTLAVQAAIDAGATEGSTYRITPPIKVGVLTITDPHTFLVGHGTVYRTGTITMRAFRGGGWYGQGPAATRMLWIGNQRDPAFILDDLAATTFADFSVKGTVATAACDAVGCQLNDAFVLINGVTSATVVPTARVFRNLWIDGNTVGLIHAGFLYAAPQSARCTGDMEPWWLCSGLDTFSAAVGICCAVGVTGCDTAQLCDRDNGVAGGTPCVDASEICVFGTNGNSDFDRYEQVWVANGMRNTDCTAAGTPAACCTDVDLGTCGVAGWRIEPSQAVTHTMHDCKFTNVRVGVTTMVTNVDGVGLLQGGSYQWYAGFGGAASYAHFAIGTPARTLVIAGHDGEGGLAFVKAGGPTTGSVPAVIMGSRFATNAVIANGDCTADNLPQECCSGLDAGDCDEVVSWGNRGPLIFEANQFTDTAASKEVRLMLEGDGTAVPGIAFGNTVKSSLANDSIFATADADNRWTLGGNLANLDGVFTPIADVTAYQATLFANLGTPPNGTIRYCSDCTKATPCAGSGTGAVAKRAAGAWDCD